MLTMKGVGMIEFRSDKNEVEAGKNLSLLPYLSLSWSELVHGRLQTVVNSLRDKQIRCFLSLEVITSSM